VALTGPRRKTRFRLLARLYRVGLVTHKVPMKGLKVYSLHLASFPKLSWRKDSVRKGLALGDFGIN
jgi:hypothetical protein